MKRHDSYGASPLAILEHPREEKESIDSKISKCSAHFFFYKLCCFIIQKKVDKQELSVLYQAIHTVLVAKRHNYIIVPFHFLYYFAPFCIARTGVLHSTPPCTELWKKLEHIWVYLKAISTIQNHYFTEILLKKKNFTHNTYSFFSLSFHFGYISRITMNLIEEKIILGSY